MDFIDHRSTANFIFSLSATDEKFRITNNGDVGIGTSSPSTKLEVNGVITTAGLTTTADINFGDNDKAVFGAGSDLQIYHDGSASYVQDTGTGALYLQGDGGVNIRNAAGTENKAVFASDGAVTLYHNNAVKFATTSTGIDVTGTVTADGLTVDGGAANNDSSAVAGKFNANGNEHIRLEISTDSTIGNQAALDLISNSITSRLFTTGSGGLVTSVNGSNRMAIATNGDISFYEDTGTTAKLFWDASAESLGIGTSSPDSLLELEATGATVFDGTATDGQAADGTTLAIQNLSDTNDTFSQILFRNRNTSKAVSRIASLTDSTGTEMAFVVENNGSPAEILRLEKTGNVGIGTSSPSQELHLRQTSGDCNLLIDSANGASQVFFGDDESVNVGSIRYDHASNYMRFSTNSAERMRIDSSGVVDIKGTGSESAPILIFGGDSDTGIFKPSSNILGFSTFGSERMRIDSSGRVGVGTSSPPAKLSVFGTGAGNATVQIEGEGGADPYINFLANNAQHWSLGVDDSDADKFKLSEHSALGTNDYLVVDVTGQVGIGTSSPSDELHVYASSGGATLKIESNTANAYDSSKLELLGGNLSTSEIVLGDASDADVGKIIYRHDGNSLAFNVNAAERMRIDSSGRVGIGTSSPANTIHVEKDVSGDWLGRFRNTNTTNGYGLLVYAGDDSSVQSFKVANHAGSGDYFVVRGDGNVGIGTASPDVKVDIVDTAADVQLRVYKFDGTNNTRLALTADDSGAKIHYRDATNGGALRFNNNAGEMARFDSSGNLLVGKSAASISTAGFQANTGGDTYHVVNGGVTAYFNRLTSDGDIVQFRKDGTTVGSIGVDYSDNLFISGNSTHAGLMFDAAHIWPYKNGNFVDATVDLGVSSGRFKDLYLSGGAYLGGTAAANHLDDYEEGTFTPTLGGGTSFGTTTYTTQTGTYTKIGDTVHVRIYLDVSATTGSGFLKIGGIPFTVASLGSIGAFLPSGLNWGGGSYLQSYAAGGDAFLRVYYATDNANWQAQQVTNETQQLLITIAYQTA